MSDQDEDLLLSNGEEQPPAWWSPSTLLTPEVTSITAFIIAVISISTFAQAARYWWRSRCSAPLPGHLTFVP
jgi:hypothetical protein